MPTVEDIKASQMVTGPSTTIKAGSINLKTKAAKLKAAAQAAAKAIPCPEGGCKYRSKNNNFRMSGINFGSSYYATKDPKELELLDSAVARKLLYVVEDKRKPTSATPAAPKAETKE